MATPPTGRPRGRPTGAKNKRTLEVEARVAETAERLSEIIPGAFDGDAHAFLMAVYKNPREPVNIRLDAAGKAIAYEKPRLIASHNTGDKEKKSLQEWLEETA
jgi:hypothetical protein